MKTLIIIALGLASIGCFGQNAETAPTVRVVVYRAKQFTARFKALPFYCDERIAAELSNGRYFVLALTPGRHTFRGADKATSVQLDIQPGEKYFIRAEQAVGAFKGTQQISSVDESLAHSEMNELKPVGVDKIWDKERVSQQ
ncbi:MAG TPA: DUF2846 domain-containing protein [Candidatus Angelobacter sp.]|jgi:hypothetical protein|nr:DUF2846 domain-containing protein [Candidatus Angelobacter sp.]